MRAKRRNVRAARAVVKKADKRVIYKRENKKPYHAAMAYSLKMFIRYLNVKGRKNT